MLMLCPFHIYLPLSKFLITVTPMMLPFAARIRGELR